MLRVEAAADHVGGEEHIGQQTQRAVGPQRLDQEGERTGLNCSPFFALTQSARRVATGHNGEDERR
jgi:hypothetical protein